MLYTCSCRLYYVNCKQCQTSHYSWYLGLVTFLHGYTQLNIDLSGHNACIVLYTASARFRIFLNTTNPIATYYHDNNIIIATDFTM